MYTLLLALLFVLLVGHVEGTLRLPRLASVKIRLMAQSGRLRFGFTTYRPGRVYYRLAVV